MGDAARPLVGPALPATILTTAAFTAGLAATQNHLVGAIIGIPLSLILPGYSLQLAIRPNSSGWRHPEWIPWILLGSVANIVIGGFVLNLVHQLTRLGWDGYLGSVIALLCLVALVRLRTGGGSESEVGAGEGSPATAFHLQSVAATAFALVLLVGALAISQLSASDTSPHFAQLWIVPTPENSVANSKMAAFGVRNLEGANAVFRVSLFEGTSQVADRTWNFTLGNGATWSHTTPRPVGVPLTVTLTFPDSHGRPYQYVNLAARVAG